MKGACEFCGVEPDIKEDDLAECEGCGKTICVNDCMWDYDEEYERCWCGDCAYHPPKESQ